MRGGEAVCSLAAELGAPASLSRRVRGDAGEGVLQVLLEVREGRPRVLPGGPAGRHHPVDLLGAAGRAPKAAPATHVHSDVLRVHQVHEGRGGWEGHKLRRSQNRTCYKTVNQNRE